MPMIRAVPVSEGLAKEQVIQMIHEGWVKIGRQVVRDVQAIVVPGQPASLNGLTDMDIWALPERVVPVSVIANVMADLGGRDGAEVLEALAQQVLGAGSYQEVRQSVLASTPPVPGISHSSMLL